MAPANYGLSTGVQPALEASANGARSGLVYTLAGADELFGIGLRKWGADAVAGKAVPGREMVRVMRAIVAGADSNMRHMEPGMAQRSGGRGRGIGV